MSNDLQKLQTSPRYVARWQSAQQQLLGNRHGAAVASYRELVQRFPGVAQLWFELGMAGMGDLDFVLAEKSFQRAEEVGARDVALLVLLGQQYHRLRRLDRATVCFEKAVAAEPSSLHALLSLAAWYERDRKLDRAWDCVETCLAKHPQNPQARCVQAMLLHRKGRNTEAETALRDVIRGSSQDVNVKYSSRQLLGVVLDALGQYAEAIKWLIEAKGIARQMANTAKMEQDYDRADFRRRRLLAELTTADIQRWREQGPAVANRCRLALLGGHPRSGTTLLEQILGVHPDIVAFDESEAFVQEIWERLAPMQSVETLTREALNSLAPARRAELGQRYFQSLLREIAGEPAAQVWLDKNPSPTASLHLWLRLFPDSKVIIALRDPRDVIISCFFQNLVLTPTNANFLSLERAAKHYGDLMDVWLRLRELGGFDWIETRYEEIVANLEPEGRRVTEFLGLAWHPDQAKHHEAGRNKFVFSPTYSDVARPVHTRAVGRWHHYAEALAPIQQRLEPYCQKFGY